MTRWKYQDGTMTWREGSFAGFSDFGGTDVTYRFKRDDGTLDLVSGARLKAAQRIWPDADYAIDREEQMRGSVR